MSIKFFLSVLTVLLTVSILFAQPVYIQTEAEFAAAVANDPWSPDGDPNQPDYVIGVDQNGNPANPPVLNFTIFSMSSLTIDEGTEIALAEGVSIIVDGAIYVGDDQAPQITYFKRYSAQAWGSIVLRGGGVQGDGTGIFFNTYIDGGGSLANGHGGLIALTNNQNLTTFPYLEIRGSFEPVPCELTNSESDGIYVYDSDCQENVQDDFRVSSTIILDNVAIRDNIQTGPILGNGIHYQGWCDEGVMSNLTIESSSILNCYGRGIYHESVRALGQQVGFDITEGFELQIDNSDISENYFDGIKFHCDDDPPIVGGVLPQIVSLNINIDNSNICENGSEAAGCGLYVSHLPCSMPSEEEGRLPGTISNISISNSHFDGNSDAGIKLWYCSFRKTKIVDSWMNNNGTAEHVSEDNNPNEPNYAHGQGALLYIRSQQCGDVRWVNIEKSEIKNNALAGVHLRTERGDADQPRSFWTLCGNEIFDNGSLLDWNDDDNDLMEGANVHCLNNIDYLLMHNNVIKGGYCGVYSESNENPNHFSYQLKIYNNSIYSENAGSTLQHGLVVEDRDIAFGDAIINNVFWNCANSAVVIRDDGILADEFVSNAIGASEQNDDQWGIYYDRQGLGPAYSYNSFWNMEDNCNHVNCVGGGVTDITNNPKFLSPNTGDFHLMWDSPLINAGYEGDWAGLDGAGYPTQDSNMELTDFQDLEDVIRDGSRNDIGAYGGLYANGTIGQDPVPIEDQQDFGWDPYCVINADCDDLSGTLKNDYYRAFSNYEVPQGNELIVEPGVFVEHDTDVEFVIEGTVDVNGTLDDPVYFTGRNQARWNTIRLKSTASSDCEFEYTHISDANIGMYFMSVTDNARKIPVTNCIIMNCQDIGMWIYNSMVHVSGNNLAPDYTQVNFDNLDTWLADPNINPDFLAARWNTIRQISGSAGTSMGLRIEGVLWDEVEIEGTKIYLCGNENQVDEIQETGIWLFDAEVFLNDITAFRNGNTGVYAVACENAHLGPVDPNNPVTQDAIDLYENGNSVNSTVNSNGAEIYIGYNFGDALDITHNDFDDVDEDNNDEVRSYHVFVDQFSDANAEGCYWGAQAGTFNPDPGQWINDLADVDHNGAVDAPGQDNEWTVQNITPFEVAVNHYYNGNYEEALGHFEELISSNPDSREAISSLKWIYNCYNEFGDRSAELRSYLVSIANEHRGTNLNVVASLLHPKSYLINSDFDSAYRGYGEIIEENEDEILSGLAEVHRLSIEPILLEDQVDGAYLSSVRDKQTEVLYELNSIAETGNTKPIPEDFSIHSIYPNPFNSTTKINFSLPESKKISVGIYDIKGRKITSLHEGWTEAGNHSVIWRADGIPSGVYLVKISDGNLSAVKCLDLIK